MTQPEGHNHRFGGSSGLRHRPTAREAPTDRADQPRTKVPGGAVTEARAGVTRSRPLNVSHARGQVQRLYSGGRGDSRLRYSLCTRRLG